MVKLFYGVSSQKEIITHIRRACEIVRYENSEESEQLLIGTCCTETNFCTYRDEYFNEGKGPFQEDSVRFYGDKKRLLNEKPDLVSKIKQETNIDIARLDYQMLEYAPLACAIMCRIGYLFVPVAIPKTLNGRAYYYKQYWNSYHPNAKGSVEKYLADWETFYAGKPV